MLAIACGRGATTGMGQTIENLEKIDHIVVLMLENRSFDHMLGYLSLPPQEGGRGRSDVDGLTGPATNYNDFRGKRYGIEKFGPGQRFTKEQDPCHSGPCVAEQMEDGMGGFVANYVTTRESDATQPEPTDPMLYQPAGNVPVFDFFAEKFAVCDRWFCSVPGSTWPNRIASLAGEAKETSNRTVPLYSFSSFVRALPKKSWRWYSSDPGSLRLVDKRYRVGWVDNFALVEKPTVIQPRTLYGDIRNGDLPSVAWIDPNFVDLGGFSGADDDHPPTDVMAAQSFVLKIYNMLRSKQSLWRKTMFVIVYDEHGGFYDHRNPEDDDLPPKFKERAEFGIFGPRVPAIVVSPFVKEGAAYGSAQGNDPKFLYDHTTLIKTILLRFAKGGFSGMPDRVKSAAHLGHLLTEDEPREPPEVPKQTVDGVTGWWAGQIGERLADPQATIPALLELEDSEGEGAEGAGEFLWNVVNWLVDHLPFLRRRPRRVTTYRDANELEQGITRAARKIRKKGLPPGQP